MRRIILISTIVAVVASTASIFLAQRAGLLSEQIIRVEHVQTTPTKQASLTSNSAGQLDFTEAAEISMPAVVHITATRTSQARRSTYRHPLEEFFFPDVQPQQRKPQVKVGTGSGVIVSADGYIMTNNHVINGADDLEITMNDNRTFKAEIIGVDPSTDLALIKVEESALPYLAFGLSDNVKVGQWVLAVGNPFNLTSTVTAGIISAKGRNINIVQDKYAIESFLQTDAAINPGNSGGALVNLNGELIGINTAIASPTGSYSGYGFAVPSEIVKKVYNDLKDYGVVQRGFIGVMIADVTAELAKEKDLKVKDGVYVSDVLETGAAKAAGIKANDVITSINNQAVATSPALQEIVGRARPGDTLQIEVNRVGKTLTFEVILTNKSGNTEIVTKERLDLLSKLGIEVAEVSKEDKKSLEISGGVQITEVLTGTIKKYTDMRPGFIVTKIDKQPISSVEQFISVLKSKKEGVMIEGHYPNQSGTYYYAFGI